MGWGPVPEEKISEMFRPLPQGIDEMLSESSQFGEEFLLAFKKIQTLWVPNEFSFLPIPINLT